MLLLEQELPVQIAQVDRVKVEQFDRAGGSTAKTSHDCSGTGMGVSDRRATDKRNDIGSGARLTHVLEELASDSTSSIDSRMRQLPPVDETA